jgi:hypothetical protein
MSRFLIGSALLMTGCVIVASAVITVVGLPLGLAVLGAGLELMVGPRHSGPTAGRREA